MVFTTPIIDVAATTPLQLKNYEAKITNVNTVYNFALQLEERKPTVSHIQTILRYDAEEYPTLTDIQVGKLCVAKFDVDSLWYRAKILELHPDSTATVYFLDFGNCDDCFIESDLKECPPELASLIPQIIECRWVHAEPAGDIMVKALAALDEACDSQAVISIQVMSITNVNRGADLLTYGEGNAGIVVSVPILDSLVKVVARPLTQPLYEAVAGADQHVSPSQISGTDTTDHAPRSSAIANSSQPTTPVEVKVFGNVLAGQSPTAKMSPREELFHKLASSHVEAAAASATVTVASNEPRELGANSGTAGTFLAERERPRSTLNLKTSVVTDHLAANKTNASMDKMPQVGVGAAAPIATNFISPATASGSPVQMTQTQESSLGASHQAQANTVSVTQMIPPVLNMHGGFPLRGLPVQPTTSNTSKPEQEAIRGLEELSLQLDLMKKQIDDMRESDARREREASVALITPEEAARNEAHYVEMIALGNRKDRLINIMVDLLAKKDETIKETLRKLDEQTAEIDNQILEANQELEQLRAAVAAGAKAHSEAAANK